MQPKHTHTSTFIQSKWNDTIEKKKERVRRNGHNNWKQYMNAYGLFTIIGLFYGIRLRCSYSVWCSLLTAQCSMLIVCQMFTPNKYYYCRCWFFVCKRREKNPIQFLQLYISNQLNIPMSGFCCTTDNFMSKSRQYLHIFHSIAAKILSYFVISGVNFNYVFVLRNWSEKVMGNILDMDSWHDLSCWSNTFHMENW